MLKLRTSRHLRRGITAKPVLYTGHGLGGISEFFVAREADRVWMPGQEGREDFVLPHRPRLRIFSGWTRRFQATPELFPRFAAFKYPNRGVRIPSRTFNALQEMMLDKPCESEKAAPLRVTDSALEGSYVHTGLQVILMNADHPSHVSTVCYSSTQLNLDVVV